MKLSDLYDFIKTDFMSEESIEYSDVKKYINILKDNNKAYVIDGYEYVPSVNPYRLSSKIILKHEPKYKKYNVAAKEKKTDDIYVDQETLDIGDLKDYALEPGTYSINLSKGDSDDYAVLHVRYDREDEYTEATLSFIGDSARKYKDKFYEKLEKYMNKYYSPHDFKELSVRYTSTGDWKRFKRRTFDQLIFHDKDKVLKYIDKWKEVIPVLYEKGITPKLSILLYGKPGTGKSTFYQSLASYLNISDIVVVEPSYFSERDGSHKKSLLKSYANLRSRLTGAMYILDDCDCISESRETAKDIKDKQVLGQLLSFLDNPDTFHYKANDGKYYPVAIVVATTNHIEKLDDAVKRYGRFDLQIEMKDFTRKEAQEMCKLYDVKLEKVYKKMSDTDAVNPAYLQSLCFQNLESTIKGGNDNVKEKIKKGKVYSF